MLLEVKRRPSSLISTIGELYVNRKFFCHTLEDIIRPSGIKISGETAIPPGEYIILLDFSQRFQRIMPHIMNVPMFEGIRIHPLNFAVQTEGCIGVGTYVENQPDTIINSRDAFNSLFPLLEEAYKKEVICISIVNPI